MHPALEKLPLVERLITRPPVVAVVRLAGVIGGVGPVRRGLTLAGLAPVIERAFSLGRLKAVALAVNSPGGSPVQSALIAGRIRALAEEKDIPVIAFAEDVAASGGYWLACAADEIYADASSIVGSIGVVSGGFGFTEMIKRLGVERRLHTSGTQKAMLDPFQRENPDHVAHLKEIQSAIHEDFKTMVRTRRGDRLKGEEADLFSGAFWTGQRAVELGLIDGLGDLRTTLRARFGEEIKLVPIGERKSWFRRRLGGTEMAGAPLDIGLAGDALIAAIEERLHWNRFGL